MKLFFDKNHSAPRHLPMRERVCRLGLFLALLSCLAGCQHMRSSAIVTVDGGIRKVVTRNRYKLAGFKFTAQNPNADVSKDNLYGRQFTNDDLKKHQPDVFADDGIPFMLREVPLPYKRSSYQWTAGLAICTLTIIPGCLTVVNGRQVTIDVLDNPDAREVFDYYYRYDHAGGMLVPSPYLFYTGDATPPEGVTNCTVVSEHAAMGLLANFLELTGEVQVKTRAYAIAALLKRLEDEGRIDGSRGKPAGRRAEASPFASDKYEIVDFRKDGDCEYRYAFTLRLRGGDGVSLRESRELQKALRTMIRDDYVASFPDVAQSSVVDFPEFSIRKGVVSGKAQVLALAVESLRYDPNTRTGMMRIRIGENQFEDARRYARKNIESLVRDKNVALDARDIPPAATFYICGETLKGGVLEMAFKTE